MSTSVVPTISIATPLGEATVVVEVASTRAQIERGLMHRHHLPRDAGMFFCMEETRVWTFWMRNTLIPLDIIFITRDFTVAGVVHAAQPLTDTLRSVRQPSAYVLEVNAGWAAAHQIIEGAPVRPEQRVIAHA